MILDVKKKPVDLNTSYEGKKGGTLVQKCEFLSVGKKDLDRYFIIVNKIYVKYGGLERVHIISGKTSYRGVLLVLWGVP